METKNVTKYLNTIHIIVLFITSSYATINRYTKYYRFEMVI